MRTLPKFYDIELVALAGSPDRIPQLRLRRKVAPPAGSLVNDNQFYSDLGRQLEIQYHEIMNRTYGYLDPGEMELVNRQATPLRERKTY